MENFLRLRATRTGPAIVVAAVAGIDVVDAVVAEAAEAHRPDAVALPPV